MNKLFRELILVAIGKQDSLSYTPTEREWSEAYSETKKQALIGFCFYGLERLHKHQLPNVDLLMDWFGQAEFIKRQNELVSKRCRDITKIFAEAGIRSVVLKGQGTALLYPHPEFRISGDIDIWVDAPREKAISFLKNKGYKVVSVFIHHIDVDVFDDVTVEVHTNPSYTYSPFRWRKYKKWFSEQAKVQFQLYDKPLGYAYPSINFNLVYSLLHIFRHVFHEGIGLRQLLDYYYILQHADDCIRREAMKTLRWFGLERFAAAVMYVEQTMFASSEEVLNGSESSKGYIDWFLCKPDPEAGRFLLDRIIQNGNFGKYNEKNWESHNRGLFAIFLHNNSQLFKMLKYYPSEVLWSPFWKPAHYVWRAVKGY